MIFFRKAMWFVIFIGSLSVDIKLSASPSADDQLLLGILVEGIDYAGKSTVCKILAEKLQAMGFKTKSQDLYLSDHYIVRNLLEKATQNAGSKDEPFFYSVATLLDPILFRSESDIFYIQDRNWLSHHCWVNFFGRTKNYTPNNYILNNHQKFKWNIYLTISYSIFKARYAERSKRSPLNMFLSSSEENFNEYNQFCISNLEKDGNWIIINTDFITPNELAEKILYECHISAR